jgi:hypothetical protein
MFNLRDALYSCRDVVKTAVRIYDIRLFSITLDPDIADRDASYRQGHLIFQEDIPDIKPGLSSNLWHIIPCGSGMLGLKMAIKELLNNDIHRLVLGYAPDVLIVHDPRNKLICRASRNIENAAVWHKQYQENPVESRLQLGKLNVLSNGELQNNLGYKSKLSGLATIAVLAFVLGESDLHSGQYLLQHNELAPQQKVWRIDFAGSFTADYPINQENLDKLPWYNSPYAGMQFKMAEHLCTAIGDSADFKQEKIQAIAVLIAKYDLMLARLNYYCDLANYDTEMLKEILSEDELNNLAVELKAIHADFISWLNRINNRALQEYITTSPSYPVLKPETLS